MKTSRVKATLKAAARRFTAGLLCLCMMISMAGFVPSASAWDFKGDGNPKVGTTVMEYTVWAWHSDSERDAVVKSGCIYIENDDTFACEGELKPDEDNGGTITIQPGNFGISDEEFLGFSISAGQDAASIDENGNLVITYTPNVHIVKAHAFFKSTGGQVAGSSDLTYFGGSGKPEQDTAAAWGYPEGTRDEATTADLPHVPITDADGKFIMKSDDPDGSKAQARVQDRLTAEEIWVSGYRDGATIDWNKTHLTDAKVYKTTPGLHTDKTVTVLDEEAREYQIDLESWFVGNNKAAVGLILDASGSMAFSSENDADGNKTFTKITHNDGKLFESRNPPGTDADIALENVKVKMDGVTNATDISRKILTNEEVNAILNSANPSEESNSGINPTENTDNSSLGYTGYNYYIFDKRANTNEYVPIGYWDGTDESLHYTGETEPGGGETEPGGGGTEPGGGGTEPGGGGTEPGGGGTEPGGGGTEPGGGDTPEPSTGMPGLENLVSYYDFQKATLFYDNVSHPDSSDNARTWGINRTQMDEDGTEIGGAGKKYAEMVDAVDASDINFSTTGTEVEDKAYPGSAKDDAPWNHFNWDEKLGLNVSYVTKNGNQLDKALLLDGELNTETNRNFTISFTLSSANKYGTKEEYENNGKNTTEKDQILYIGPLENSEKNYLSIYRDSNGSDSRLKIGNVASGSNNVIFSMKHFETILGLRKANTGVPITYTLTFEYDETKGKTKVKVYRDGKITHTDSTSDTVDNENTYIELPENCRVILGGLKDKYDGQDLYVDNVYIFKEALSASDVRKLYDDYQNNPEVKESGETQAHPWTIEAASAVSTVSAPLSRIAEPRATSGTGMPGYSANADDNHLVSYYDFQNTVLFKNTAPNDNARTWGINRAPSGTEKYAKMIDAVNAGDTINFGTPGTDVTDSNYTNKEEAVWNKVNWDTNKGFNVSYEAKDKQQLTKALLLDGKLNTAENKAFTVSFTLSSAKKHGIDEKTAKNNNQNEDQILYIGPLDNSSKQYVNVFRASGGSDARLKIGQGGSGTNGDIYNNKDFEKIVDKDTPITYTLVFTTSNGTTNVKVYTDGDTAKSDGSTSSKVPGASGYDLKFELPEDCRVILGGLTDNYDGQDLYVDNVYIFDTALSSSEVKTLYNKYQNDDRVKATGTEQAMPWTITPKPDTPVTPGTTGDGLLYFTVGESESATALLQDEILNTPAKDRAGWYYVTSTSQWSNILEAGTAKTMDALRNDIKSGEETNKPYYFNGVTEGDDEAEGKLNSDIAPEGTPEGGYYYYQPDQFEPLKFFLDENGHLCCFYGSGNASMDANGWSHVYMKKNTARIKVEVLQHALGRFDTKLSENTPSSTIGAVRFSTQRYGKSTETFETTEHTDELKKFKLLDWTSDAQNAISILNNERSGAGANGVEANDDGQYNYVLTGNTSTAAGFKTYNNYLKDDLKVEDDTKKYLIVFTDGKDSDLSSALSDKSTPIEDLLNPEKPNALEAVKLAKDLRDDGYTILCVMLSGGSVTRGSEDYEQAIQFLAALAGEEYNKDYIPANYDPKAYNEATQYQNVFEGHTSDEITEAFSEDIVGRIADSLNNYVVKDYIDPRFDLVDSSDRVWKLGEDGWITIGSNEPEDIKPDPVNKKGGGQRIYLRPENRDGKIEGYSAVLYYDTEKKAYYLEWNTVTIPGCSEGVNALGVWNAQITVKAKDDFIGGNAILTNGDAANENYVYPGSIPSGDTDTTSSSSGTNDAKREPETVSGDTQITNYPSKGFPRTTVNVGVTGLEINKGRQVLFMGEALTREDVAKQLGDNVDSAWYWDYLKRYAKYQNAVDSSYKPTDGTSKEPFDMLIEELVTSSEKEYPYYYLPDDAGADAKVEQIGTLKFTWKDITGTDEDDETDGTTEYVAYPTDNGITTDISPRRSKLTVKYTPDERSEIKITDTAYQWDQTFKPAGGSDQIATDDITGSYTTNIVSGEIAFAMELSADVVKYLQKFAPGQTVTYQAQLVRKDTGSDDVIGTYTATYTVPDEPEADPAEKTVPATIVYTDDTYAGNGLPRGEYAVKPIGGSGFGITFGEIDTVTLTSTTATEGFSRFDANTTKKASEIIDPSTAAGPHTINDFAAETDTDGTIIIGGKTSGGSAYLDKRYAMAQISAHIDTSALSISKKVVGAPLADANKAFEFTITLDGVDTETYTYDGNPTTVNGAAPADKHITLTEGKATVTLQNAQSIAIRNIPVGTSYTVRETDDSDYTPEVTAGSATGAISAAGESSVEYTNTHKNSYKVFYDLNGGVGTVPADYVNAGYAEGETAELCPVTEANVTKTDAVFLGWSLTKPADVIKSQEDADEIEIITEIKSIDKNTTVYAVWAIDVKGGSGDDPDPSEPVDPTDNPPSPDGIADYLEVTLTYDKNGGDGIVPKPKAYQKETRVTLDDGKGLTLENAVFLGWSLTKNGIIKSQAEATAAGIISEIASIEKDTTVFAVWAEDENHNDIPDYNETIPTPGDTGTLTIHKVVDGDGVPTTDVTYTFEVSGGSETQTVTITGSGSTSLDLEPGTYTVTETTNGDFTTMVDTIAGKTTTVGIESGENTDVTFTNTYENTAPPVQTTGTLTIHKVVDGDGAPTIPETYTFEVSDGSETQTVTITGSGSTSLNLEPGTYSVSETDAGDNCTTTYQVDGVAASSPAEVTIETGDTVTVTVTNTYDAAPPVQTTGTLTIHKVVDGDGAPTTDVTYTFEVSGGSETQTVTITGEGEATINDLPAGTYSVTETTNGDFTTTVNGEETSEAEVTVTAGHAAEVTFTNTYTDSGTTGDKYTLTYDANGGTGDAPRTRTYNKGTKVTLVSAEEARGNLTRYGAVLIGWSTEPHEGIIQSQAEEDTVTMITEIESIQEDTTVYAVWAIDVKGGPGKDPDPGKDVDPETNPSNPSDIPDYKEVTLTYDANGGTGTVPADKTYLKGTKVDLVSAEDARENLTRYGAVLIGWSLKQNTLTTSQAEEDAAGIITVTEPLYEDTTVYAVWAIDENHNNIPDYKETEPTPGETASLHYDRNGGTGTPPPDETHNKGTMVTLAGSNGLKRDDAVFLGWSLKQNNLITSQAEEDAAGIITEIASIEKDTTVYAVWAIDVKGGTGDDPDPGKDVDPETNPSNPSDIPDYKEVTLTYDRNGGTGDVPPAKTYLKGTRVTLVSAEDARENLTRYGAVLIGWSTEPHVGIITSQAEEDAAGIITEIASIQEDTTVYAVWAIDVKGGSGTNPDPGKPVDPETNPSNPSDIPDYKETDPKPDPGTDPGYRPDPKPDPGSKPDPDLYTPPEEFNAIDHVAYIAGYPDGEVKPENNITRAEVVTILFRLLKDEVRNQYWATENSFSDVNEGDWFNTAISTVANMKLVDGYPDGTFRPNARMTRAELAAVISRFFAPEAAEKGMDFADVGRDAWYYEYVRTVSAMGIMTGKSETMFHPEALVKRSEAMATFNRLLDHRPTVDGLIEEGAYLNKWPDNADKSVWYYADVQEATNSHTCETFVLNGLTRERWTAVLPAPDWAALERAWIAANQAG